MFEDVWPNGRPLPLTNANARLERGHLIHWRSTLEEALDPRGMYAMMDAAVTQACTFSSDGQARLGPL